MFESTKVIELGSCAFRQPFAKSHCRHLHGYRLTAKFWFQCNELDDNNWVVDFGCFKSVKDQLRNVFDHTLCIAANDPLIDLFKQLAEKDGCDLIILNNGVGIERFAELAFDIMDNFVINETQGRVKCVKCEVFEHEDNSAIYLRESEEETLNKQREKTTKTEYKKDIPPMTNEPESGRGRPAPVGQKSTTGLGGLFSGTNLG